MFDCTFRESNSNNYELRVKIINCEVFIGTIRRMFKYFIVKK